MLQDAAEGAAPARLVVAGHAGIDVCDDPAVEREAGISDGCFDGAAHEEARRRQKRQRQRNLSHDERVAHRQGPSPFFLRGLLLQQEADGMPDVLKHTDMDGAGGADVPASSFQLSAPSPFRSQSSRLGTAIARAWLKNALAEAELTAEGYALIPQRFERIHPRGTRAGIRQAVNITMVSSAVMPMNVTGSTAGICATSDLRSWLTP